jgi:hypothetical protein
MAMSPGVGMPKIFSTGDNGIHRYLTENAFTNLAGSRWELAKFYGKTLYKDDGPILGTIKALFCDVLFNSQQTRYNLLFANFGYLLVGLTKYGEESKSLSADGKTAEVSVDRNQWKVACEVKKGKESQMGDGKVIPPEDTITFTIQPPAESVKMPPSK